MLPEKFSCPRCKCHALYRTRRRGVDWIMSSMGLRPVRCMTCEKRFYLRYSVIKKYDPDPPQQGSRMRSMSARIEKQIAKKMNARIGGHREKKRAA